MPKHSEETAAVAAGQPIGLPLDPIGLKFPLSSKAYGNDIITSVLPLSRCCALLVLIPMTGGSPPGLE